MVDICQFCEHPYGSTYKDNRGRVIMRRKTGDHIIPLSRGGTNSPDNIQYCCSRCNELKGEDNNKEWADKIANVIANIDTQQGVVKRNGIGSFYIHHKLIDLKTILSNLSILI